MVVTVFERVLAVWAVMSVVATSAAVVGIRFVGGASASTEVDARNAPVRVVEYNLGDTAFTDPPDFDNRTAEIKAVVHYPSRSTAQRMPLIVMLHGQNEGCEGDDEETWPCPRGVKPVPSYRGYDYLGEALAARGFVVVSVSANGLNVNMGIDQQRGRLINKHLALWQQLATTGAGRLAGKFTDAVTGNAVRVDFKGHVDLTKVGTMGHSVAGGGIMWQASNKHRTEVPEGVKIKAAVPLASRYFEVNEGDLLVTDIPFAVVSATCWGDGDRKYFTSAKGKNTAPISVVTVVGGNHNFFNTVWSVPGPVDGVDGDDSDPELCGPSVVRPSEQAQRDFAVTFFTAYYEKTLKGSTACDAILTGKKPFAGVTTKVEYEPAVQRG